MKTKKKGKSKKTIVKYKKGGGKTKQISRLSKWLLPTLPRSALGRMDSETLNKYAKMYKVKPCKGCEPYTDKDLIRELKKFIASNKIKSDYYKCLTKGKKYIGKNPITPRNNTSEKFKRMSLHEQVKHINNKVRKLRKKHKKEIDAYHKRSRKINNGCNIKREKDMKKQIKGK